jgi:beta-lactamase class A
MPPDLACGGAVWIRRPCSPDKLYIEVIMMNAGTRHLVTRRGVLGLSLGTLVALGASRSVWAADSERVTESLAAVEARSGGRLGVAVLDSHSGARLAYRGDERFPMCSTFKFLAAAAILQRVDAGKDNLDRRIPYGQHDLLQYAPVTKEHVAEGSMTLEALCAAAVEMSDNTAANLLLQVLGGPVGITAFCRSLGDQATRLDRNEPELNEALPGDERDTTTPTAMLGCMERLLLADALTPGSRAYIERWMVNAKPGPKRLPAAIPAGARVGHKTGTGERGTSNDIAIVWPAERKPVLIAAYLTGASGNMEARDPFIAEAGRIVFTRL